MQNVQDETPSRHTSSVAIRVKISPQAMVVSSTFLDFGRLGLLSEPHKKAVVGWLRFFLLCSLQDGLDLLKHRTLFDRLARLLRSNLELELPVPASHQKIEDSHAGTRWDDAPKRKRWQQPFVLARAKDLRCSRAVFVCDAYEMITHLYGHPIEEIENLLPIQ